MKKSVAGRKGEKQRGNVTESSGVSRRRHERGGRSPGSNADVSSANKGGRGKGEGDGEVPGSVEEQSRL